jgi:hypothetical protein
MGCAPYILATAHENAQRHRDNFLVFFFFSFNRWVFMVIAYLDNRVVLCLCLFTCATSVGYGVHSLYF